jgi:aldose 1-epimerase
MMGMSASLISKAPFGKTPGGEPVERYTLRNKNGMEADILTYGGIVASLKTPDKNGKFEDVVLGFDNLEGYLKDKNYQGAIIGRYCNRIAQGKFALEGKTYSIATNDNGHNHLHGGHKGFNSAVWTAKTMETANGAALELRYLSKDGEEGFPGNLTVTAVYTVTNDNALRLDFTATTDKHTICNLTNHAYFNLRGQGDVLDYSVQIHADKYTPADAKLIPTGELRAVAGTPFDFRQPMAVGKHINNGNEEIHLAKGYDQNWIVNKPVGQLAPAARVTDHASGRCLEVLTTEPGIQFYTGNFLKNVQGKGGRTYQQREAFCLEPQHFPDSPNKPQFPSLELKPGQVYQNTIIYKFSAE